MKALLFALAFYVAPLFLSTLSITAPSFICPASLYAQALFPVIENGKWGYIDSTGKMIIKPQYEGAVAFSNGLGLVVQNKKVGYIDATGKFIVNPKYDGGVAFSDGVASVYEDEDYGVIDKTGKMIIDPKFPEPLMFKDGMAMMKVGKSLFAKWGFIDRTGSEAIPAQFEAVGDFSEGMALFMKSDKCGYIDKTGKVVIEPKYYYGAVIKINGVERYDRGKFSNSLARITLPKSEKMGEGDKGFSMTTGDKSGYIDKMGKVVIEPKFAEAEDFSEGLAAAKMDSLYGYIDMRGNWVIQPQFYLAEPFVGGLAAVKTKSIWEGNYGFIDRTGKLVIAETVLGAVDFSAPLTFKDGLAMVYVEPGIWGYIDRTGKVVWKMKAAKKK